MKVSKLDDLDFLVKQNVQEYAGVLSMSEDEIAMRDKLRSEFRSLLRSLLVK
jgi:hypothetical protein